MIDFASDLTHRIAPAIADFIERTSPGCAPARQWTGAEAESRFEGLARDLFAVQYALNAPFQALCRVRGVQPDTLKSWREIPAVPTAAFKELEVTCLPASERPRVFHSSGTSVGRPGLHYHDSRSLALYERSLLQWFAPHVLAEIPDLEADEHLAPGQDPAFLSLTPPAEAVPQSSLVHMFSVAMERHGARDSVFAGRLDGAGAWELDLDRLLFAVRKSMCANRPVFLMGTAFNFVQLLDHFEAGNIRYRLATGSRVLETGGYKGRTREVPKADLHAAISRHLGIPATRIGCEYGMCELSSQAYDQPATGDRRFRFPPWVRVRVVSPETGRELSAGQAGILQVFDLANVWSVAAVQTADLGVRSGDGSFALLGRAGAAEPKGCSLNV